MTKGIKTRKSDAARTLSRRSYYWSRYGDDDPDEETVTEALLSYDLKPHEELEVIDEVIDDTRRDLETQRRIVNSCERLLRELLAARAAIDLDEARASAAEEKRRAEAGKKAARTRKVKKEIDHFEAVAASFPDNPHVRAAMDHCIEATEIAAEFGLDVS